MVIVNDGGMFLHLDTFTEVYDMYGDSAVWDYVEEIYVVVYEEEEEENGEYALNEIYYDDEGYFSEEDSDNEEEDIPEGW